MCKQWLVTCEPTEPRDHDSDSEDSGGQRNDAAPPAALWLPIRLLLLPLVTVAAAAAAAAAPRLIACVVTEQQSCEGANQRPSHSAGLACNTSHSEACGHCQLRR